MTDWNDEYIRKRKIKKRVYRLHQRVSAIDTAIKKNCRKNNFRLLEIASGDGKFLSELHKLYSKNEFFGIELSEKLANLNDDVSVKIVCASGENLPYEASYFDIVVMPAAIEHIKNVGAALTETKRVLKDGGLLIITWPNPFWDRINGIFVDTGHINSYRFSVMSRLLNNFGFNTIKKYGFMLFPFFDIPLHRFFENIFGYFGLDFLLFNYLIVSEKR
ncbi:MAG TPA: hypothetical protein DCX95_03840 [Elusimicrobia bacterium]|nr:hypothetical protein [Elusimicrobiota bacterium]